jgi:lysozyme
VRKVNKETRDLIKEFEGLRLKAYLCPAGVWTIGYGHTKGVKQGDVITKELAEKYLDEDIAKYEAGVEKLLTRSATDGQFGAFVSLAFNLKNGIQKVKDSTALKRFNAGNIVGAAEALTWFNKARDPRTGKMVILPGLTRRRMSEKALFLSDIENDINAESIPQEPQAADVVGGESTGVVKSKTWWASVLAFLGWGVSNIESVPTILPQAKGIAEAFPQEAAAVVVGVAILFIMYNRWREARAGEH